MEVSARAPRRAPGPARGSTTTPCSAPPSSSSACPSWGRPPPARRWPRRSTC